MFLISLYAVAITVGLCLYWFLHSGTWKKPSPVLPAAPIGEHKDPPDDTGNCSSATHYFKSHKSPRKVQLKEVHHSNETASVKVMTPDGVTLVQTADRTEHRDEKTRTPAGGAAPHKRRPAPPPPPKQPPKRPPPPPPPVTPPPTAVVVVVNGVEDVAKEMGELRIDVKTPDSQHHAPLCPSASSPHLMLGRNLAHSPCSSHPSSCCGEDLGCPSSPELPLPPPPAPEEGELLVTSDEPLPPPPDPREVEGVATRMLDSSSLVYPKNSYMSYRSERKLGRQGFDGKYRRSFHASASSVDLTTLGTSFQDGKDVLSPSSWEQMHNIRQHGTTVIFHSDCMQPSSLQNRLQRSSSQDCVLAEEPTQNPNISNGDLKQSEHNQSSSSISTQCSSETANPLDSAPYPTSHERRAKYEVMNSSINHHVYQNGISSKSKRSGDVIINCEPMIEDLSSLDNGVLTDDSFVDSMESDTSSLTSVDHNQNSVKNVLEDSDSRFVNGNDYINRTNSSTQTTDTPRLRRKCSKTKEELECERLSMDFIHHYGDITLKNLLVPAPSHKTMSHYMEGLLNLELEKGGHPARRSHSITNNHRIENGQRDEKWSSNDRCNSVFESKMKQINHCIEINDNQNVGSESELKKRKEELIISIGKKVEILKGEQTTVREEMLQNQMLGQEISNRLQKLAKPNEIDKFCLHVEEMEKIVNLLLSLSGRLARAENMLSNMPKENSEERRILEAKRDKLREQHGDACRLKESIDRRSNQVSTFLHRYFTDDEYADYDHFIKMKTKLIVDVREIDEKINLGEEQLAALRNSVVAQLWKSANS